MSEDTAMRVTSMDDLHFWARIICSLWSIGCHYAHSVWPALADRNMEGASFRHQSRLPHLHDLLRLLMWWLSI